MLMIYSSTNEEINIRGESHSQRGGLGPALFNINHRYHFKYVRPIPAEVKTAGLGLLTDRSFIHPRSNRKTPTYMYQAP